MTRWPRWRRAASGFTPLFWYLAMTVLVPLVKGRTADNFTVHLVLVGTIPVAMIVMDRCLRGMVRSVKKAMTKNKKVLH